MARRTLTQYLDLMRHGLGKTPASQHVLLDTFNDAGRALFTWAQQPPWYHPWSWTVRDDFPLTIPGNQEGYVVLPDDFGAIVSLTYRNTYVGRIHPVGIARLNELRQTANIDPLQIFIAFDLGDPLQDGVNPRKVAAIWPTRDDPIVNVRMTYERVWADFSASDTTRVPDIPQEWERLFLLLARAFSIHLEDQAAAYEDEAVKAETERLVTFDALRQTEVRRPSHSVAARTRQGLGFPNWYGRQITRPG